MTSTVTGPVGPVESGPADLRPRLVSVDLLRGAVMVLMLLDHTRDYFTDMRISPGDLSRASAALFLTRWVTHFCAPVFMFLAGTGACLAGLRKTRAELARYLLVRGLLLVALEFTVVKFGLLFQPAPRMYLAVVLWAIGWSMVALSVLVFLPLRVVGALGVAMILLHDLADGIRADDLGRLRPLWVVLHQPGLLQSSYGFGVFVLYPLVPWIGVMAAGYAFGPLLRLKPERRRRVLLGLGLALTAAFVAIRATNLYGDPQPWSVQKDALFTVLSFLNCSKYPPSLLFLLMTLGPAIAALALFDRATGASAVGRLLVTLGRVPLFFFVLQWYVIHGLTVAVAFARGQPTGWLFADAFPLVPPPGCVYGLPFVYLMWAVALLLLYPPCRWFAAQKARRPGSWLSYF
jgi:uncharacterized membrane protein